MFILLGMIYVLETTQKPHKSTEKNNHNAITVLQQLEH